MRKNWVSLAVFIYGVVIFAAGFFVILPIHGAMGALLMAACTLRWGFKGGILSLNWVTLIALIQIYRFEHLTTEHFILNTVVYLAIILITEKHVQRYYHKLQAAVQSESRLRSILNEYETIFNGTQDAMFLVDVNVQKLEVRYRRLNTVNENLTGLSNTQVAGKTPTEALGEEIGARLEENYTQCCIKGIPIDYEEILDLPGGRKIWHTKLNPIIKDGKVTAIVGSSTDITKRKQTEEALKEQEQTFRELFHNVNDAIYLSGVNESGMPGQFLQVNEAACRMLGYTEEELIRMSPMDLEPGEIWRDASEVVKYLKERRHHTFERIHLSKDGRKIPVEIGSHYFELNGEPVFLSIARDVRERKRTEEKLRQSEERYKQLVELLPDAVFILKDRKIIFANKAGVELLGMDSLMDLVGMEAFQFISPDRHERLEQYFGSLGKQVGRLNTREERITRADGSTTHVEYEAARMTFHEEPAIVMVVRDITERKRMEELKKKVEEDEKLLRETLEYDRLKTEFFANVSHELRTPLNVILGTVQLAEMVFKETAKSEFDMSKYLKIMKQNCYRLLRLVNNLIDITRIDTGFLTLSLQNHNIVHVVEEITLSVSQYIENKGIHLEFDTDVEERVMACDPDKIERIMLNLLSNAVKFTRAGGRIQVNMEDKGDRVLIWVRDTGVGIPPDKLDMIFERFRQVDRLMVRNHEGSGIGLSLVKSLIEMHGGQISLRSEYGKGSEFLIELPVRVLSDVEDIHQQGSMKIAYNHVERIDIEFSDIYS